MWMILMRGAVSIQLRLPSEEGKKRFKASGRKIPARRNRLRRKR